VFVIVSHFCASLIFVGKVQAYWRLYYKTFTTVIVVVFYEATLWHFQTLVYYDKAIIIVVESLIVATAVNPVSEFDLNCSLLALQKKITLGRK
jgi:hypothetical protein